MRYLPAEHGRHGGGLWVAVVIVHRVMGRRGQGRAESRRRADRRGDAWARRSVRCSSLKDGAPAVARAPYYRRRSSARLPLDQQLQHLELVLLEPEEVADHAVVDLHRVVVAVVAAHHGRRALGARRPRLRVRPRARMAARRRRSPAEVTRSARRSCSVGEADLAARQQLADLHGAHEPAAAARADDDVDALVLRRGQAGAAPGTGHRDGGRRPTNGGHRRRRTRRERPSPYRGAGRAGPVAELASAAARGRLASRPAIVQCSRSAKCSPACAAWSSNSCPATSFATRQQHVDPCAERRVRVAPRDRRPAERPGRADAQRRQALWDVARPARVPADDPKRLRQAERVTRVPDGRDVRLPLPLAADRARSRSTLPAASPRAIPAAAPSRSPPPRSSVSDLESAAASSCSPSEE